MTLNKIDYQESNGENNNWSLNGLTLGKINLLVGKNAAGKSRTIERISALAGMLIGQPLMTLETIDSAKFSASFNEEKNDYQYILETNNRDIIIEQLIINGEVKLERGKGGQGRMFYEKENKYISFQFSDNWPAMVYRRDSIQHPYLESLFIWADGLRLYSFGSSRELGQRNMLATPDPNKFPTDNFNIRDAVRVNELYLKGSREFGPDFDNKIVIYMQNIGYDISNLSVSKNPHGAVLVDDNTPLYMLCVKEKDRNANLYQTGMSQGMFRALSLLIQMTYNILRGISSTILIEDIGEGLDFDRSTKLISLLIEIAENNNIQLIMSTNDRYVMNKVPLEYWQVIQRKGGACKVFNMRNSKEKFDDFEYTGLSNFDFLKTDFINSS